MSKWFGASSGQTCANNCGGIRRPGSSFCDECITAYPSGVQCGNCGRVMREGEKRIETRNDILCVSCSKVKVRH
jgi:hypothetical protein